MLIDYDIEGNKIDKVKIAIERLKCMEQIALEYHENGFYVAESGGKDSMCITFLAYLAKVKFEIVHNHTTIDHFKTIYHIRLLKKWWSTRNIEFTISYPTHKGERISFWKMIETRGFPNRVIRWCCSTFKEKGGKNRVVVTGVRWAESVKRKTRNTYETFTTKKENRLSLNNDNDFKRKSIEHCMSKGKVIVNPIIDWSDSEVWQFIKQYQLPYNPLYDEGYKRVGCIGCPLVKNKIELEKNPKYKNMYIKSGAKFIENRIKRGLPVDENWNTGEKYYKWWVTQGRKQIAQVDGQTEWGD